MKQGNYEDYKEHLHKLGWIDKPTILDQNSKDFVDLANENDLKWGIIIKTFIFTDETSDILNELINASFSKELAGLLCLDINDKIYIESITEGTEESVENLPSCCEEGMRKLGLFHTHPIDEIERISSNDYLYFNKSNDFLMCIGQKINNKIKIKIIMNKNLTEDDIKERDRLIDELGEIDMLINLGYSKKEITEILEKENLYDKINNFYEIITIEDWFYS